MGLRRVFLFGALAVWLSSHASAQNLIENQTILIELGRWKWMVIAGIMGATISSAMSMAVGAPRILVALGRHSIIPLSSSFARLNAKGEPTAAILLTALITLVTLLLGTLNSVAGLLTMFFLITYGMINLSVFIEQSIGIASFRPSFRVPRISAMPPGRPPGRIFLTRKPLRALPGHLPVGAIPATPKRPPRCEWRPAILPPRRGHHKTDPAAVPSSRP